MLKGLEVMYHCMIEKNAASLEGPTTRVKRSAKSSPNLKYLSLAQSSLIVATSLLTLMMCLAAVLLMCLAKSYKEVNPDAHWSIAAKSSPIPSQFWSSVGIS